MPDAASETHDVAPFRGRAGAMKAGSGEAAYGLGNGNKGDVMSGAGMAYCKLEGCRKMRSSPEDSAMK